MTPPETLTTEALDSHADAVEAARACELSGMVVGHNLIALKKVLGIQAWRTWLKRDCPIPKAAVGRYMRVAGR